MNKKIVIFILCMLVSTNIVLVPIVSADVIDQECPSGNTLMMGVSDGFVNAQSFIPQESPLTKVELWMYKSTGNPGDFVVSIRSDLYGGDLTSITKSQNQIGGLPIHWEEFDFSDIDVNIGSTYYIVFSGPDTGGNDDIYVIKGHCEGDNAYPYGTSWFLDNNEWLEEPGDFSFRTYTTDPPDTNPPTPNPSTWHLVPHANGPHSISMTATSASDPSGSIEYFFEETTGHYGGSDSGWQSSNSYTDNGLNPSGQYTYRVKTRDALGNTGSWSISKSATTDPLGDPPSVTTVSATDIICNGATLNGNLDSVGGYNNCQVWFVFDEESHSNWNSYDYDTSPEAKNSPGPFSTSFSRSFGFEETVTIFYRAVASNSGGTVMGSEKSFVLPFLEMSPELLDFGEVLQDVTTSKTFEIWNAGDGTFGYAFDWETGWINDVTPLNGHSTGEHDEITVTIDTHGLGIGQKFGRVYIDTGHTVLLNELGYPVKVKVVNSIPPPDVQLTVDDLDFYLFSENPLINDLLLDKWSSIPDDLGNAGYNHYGYEANLDTGYIRSAVKAKYNLGLLIPDWVYCKALLRATYTVPDTPGYITYHSAEVNLAGNCNGQVWIEDLGGSRAGLEFIIIKGAGELYPNDIFSEAYKNFNRYEVGAFISDDEWSFSHDFTYDNNRAGVIFEEGETYSFWIIITSSLLLEGLNIKGFGYYGKGWSDIEFNFDSINIDYHNPPPAPPENEHPPEITNLVSPSELIVGESGSFTASATDQDGDNIVYKWYWGDGSETDWVSNTQSHSYETPGRYLIRVQAKDTSEYELLSDVSIPNVVFISRPDNTLQLTKPEDNEIWSHEEQRDIKWDYTIKPGDQIFITLHKEDNPDYQLDITPEPISIYSKSYTWTVQNDITPGDDYLIVLWSNSGCAASETFTIMERQHPLKPEKPSSDIPNRGKLNVEYTFKSKTTDPQGDKLYYMFDWGDGTDSGWLGPYESGVKVERKHAWVYGNTAIIKVKAKDEDDHESLWSDYLEINFGQGKSKNTGFFKLYILNKIINFINKYFNNYLLLTMIRMWKNVI